MLEHSASCTVEVSAGVDTQTMNFIRFSLVVMAFAASATLAGCGGIAVGDVQDTPVLALGDVPSDKFVTASTVVLTGTVSASDDSLSGVRVTVNGRTAPLDHLGNWSKTVVVKPGRNRVYVQALRNKPLSTSDRKTITLTRQDSNTEAQPIVPAVPVPTQEQTSVPVPQEEEVPLDATLPEDTVQCTAGVTVSAGTSCLFAARVFKKYVKQASVGAQNPSVSIEAYNNSLGQHERLDCQFFLVDSSVVCTGDKQSQVSFVAPS